VALRLGSRPTSQQSLPSPFLIDFALTYACVRACAHVESFRHICIHLFTLAQVQWLRCPFNLHFAFTRPSPSRQPSNFEVERFGFFDTVSLGIAVGREDP